MPAYRSPMHTDNVTSARDGSVEVQSRSFTQIFKWQTVNILFVAIFPLTLHRIPRAFHVQRNLRVLHWLLSQTKQHEHATSAKHIPRKTQRLSLVNRTCKHNQTSLLLFITKIRLALKQHYQQFHQHQLWTQTVSELVLNGTSAQLGYTVTFTSDWIEHGFTSAPTQYRLYGRQFLQVWWPNQQCQSTEGG